MTESVCSPGRLVTYRPWRQSGEEKVSRRKERGNVAQTSDTINPNCWLLILGKDIITFFTELLSHYVIIQNYFVKCRQDRKTDK